MYKGSNAEKLHNMNMYDLLCRMQENENQMFRYGGIPCIIGCITNRLLQYRCIEHKRDCNACIQAFLNEEYDGKW